MSLHVIKIHYFLLCIAVSFGLMVSPAQAQARHQSQAYLIAGSTLGAKDGADNRAQFYKPNGIKVFRDGLLVIDQGANTIRRLSEDGRNSWDVVTLAGKFTGCAAKNGSGAEARFCDPANAVADQDGNLYVTDMHNHIVRKLTFSKNQQVEVATLNACDKIEQCEPNGITIDTQSNLYVTDTLYNRIYKINSKGVVSTFAGGGDTTSSSEACKAVDGKGAEARFCGPAGITIDSQDNLYVADMRSGRIRKIYPDANVETIAGGESAKPNLFEMVPLGSVPTAGTYKGCKLVDGPGNDAQFCSPVGIAIDQSGNLYVTDMLVNAIRKIDNKGTVTTIADNNITIMQGSLLKNSIEKPMGIAVIGPKKLVITTKDKVLGINF